MKDTDYDQDLDIKFKYQFCSFLAPLEEERYIQKIIVDIIKTDDRGNDVQIIGKASIKIILIAQAVNDGYDIYDVFDADSYTMRIGNMIYDFDNYEIKEDLQRKLFGDDMMINPNICIFERMMILPEYRGLGIGAKFVKDRFHFFSSTCGLIVMQPYPLQLEAVEPNGRTDEFEKRMGYETMEKNVQKATKSLKDYYKSIGYISVRGYKDLMFLVPCKRNTSLDAINMNEMIIKRKSKQI